jgi:hypothetical protein
MNGLTRVPLSAVLALAALVFFEAVPHGPLATRVLAQAGGPAVARITVHDDGELRRLVSLGLDLLEMREGNERNPRISGTVR